ncbi:sterile alpha motif domain-containing protein 1-like isoform X2 [Scyliorhinus torazame]|uniref:sterile alpha motif domain-containing protein 1-like isoform X2 n=1 Tax=Scyliorhinus torazame TaxID=75743 RepID=UPI003B5A700F
MSEAECKQWILDTIESLRCRKARPDLERICKMVQRRHGLAPSRTRRQLERLLRSRTVLRVSYKGSHSYRNAERAAPAAGAAERGQPQLHAVLTRARLRGVREQQVDPAGGRRQRPAERSRTGSRRRIPDPGAGTERKKARRSKEADPSDGEGSEEGAPQQEQDSVSQTFSEAQNGPEPVTDWAGEEHDTEEGATKPPTPEERPPGDVIEELPTDQPVQASSAVERSPSRCPGGGSKDPVGAEVKLDVEAVQERLSPDESGKVGSSEESLPVAEGCGEECSQEPCTNQDTPLSKDCSPYNPDGPLDTMLLGQIPAANPSPKPEAVASAAGLSPDPRDLAPEVAGASCLLTPSASPIDMVPEENGPTDRHLLEENGKSVDPIEWSIADVVNYFKEAGFPDQASAFEDQEIDGKSLLLMKRNDVLTGLAIKLGPALKIYEYHIKVLQLHHFNNEAPSC